MTIHWRGSQPSNQVWTLLKAALCMLLSAGLTTAVHGHENPEPSDTHEASACFDEGPFGLPGLTGAPDVIGEWGELLDWPVMAVHATLMHTGKVMFHRTARPAYVFDPLTEEITDVSTPGLESPEYNSPNDGNTFLFCSAHTALADGKILVTGGTLRDPEGIPDTYLFDPKTEEWSTTGFMEYPRYYPSVVTLLDGRVMVHSGTMARNSGGTGRISAPFPEVYDPATGRWNTLFNAASHAPTYPLLHALPDGIVLKSGPYIRTSTLDVEAEEWTAGPLSTFATTRLPSDGTPSFSGTMYRQKKVIKLGGYDSGESTTNNLNRVELLDWSAPDPQWREVSGMEFGRRRANSVILPDGDVLIVGGAVAGQNDHECAVYAPELWNPDTEEFTTLASQQRPRVYHSIALLLPDGRVLSASGENAGIAGREENAEIYSPPYLFKGSRPTITAAPAEVSFEHDFVITTPDAANIDSVVLIRPGSVTHQVDMEQRYVPLSYTVMGDEIHTSAPPNSDAPPGYYMLFILNDGIPSVAPMVQLTFDPSMDTDGDGMPDNFEDIQGFDKNDPTDASEDFDSDTLTNLAEFTAGSAPKNADWDHDNLNDANELLAATDPNDSDTDADGMPDGWEVLYGLNPLDPSDAELNNDDDAFTNLEEFINGFNPNLADIDDFDGDGMPNAWETLHGLDPNDPADALVDIDGDWLTNIVEYTNGTNPTLKDTDGDSLNDFTELQYNTNPADADSDDDGVDDATEIANGLNPLSATDTDSDGMANDYETLHNLDPEDPADGPADRDGDGLTNLSESLYQTDIDNPDTDADGLTDAEEVLVDFQIRTPTDPLDPDTDDDGMPDGFEVHNNLDANTDDANNDPDGDGLHNYGEFRLGGDPYNAGSPEHSHDTFESFETGLPTDWEIPAGATGWAPNSANAATGGFSLTSGNIPDSGSAEIVLPLYTHDSMLRFDYFVSSAPGDQLQVFLDGVAIVTSDGEVDWTPSTDIPLLEGFHEIRFVYTKDAANTGGCDCARIDGFEFAEFPLDLDGDGMPGAWEDKYGLDRNNPADGQLDLDKDGSWNRGEFKNGTNPLIKDTDGDWLSDGYEVLTLHTDPTRKDTDSDQINDFMELMAGTDPLVPNWPALQIPAENQATEAKRVLGKILFWEEQLSSDDTVACGTCHMGSVGGGDPRIADAHPGPDGLPDTADDILGSPGVVHRDAAGDAVNDPVFGLLPQITRRNSPSIYLSMYGTELFLDGRASETFIDPADGSTVLMASGAALETQAIEPIVSSVEMAKDGRTWAEVTAKLNTITPLALASHIPPDMTAALLADTDYPQLFNTAFGDAAITPARIAMAIASYERTLIPDQAPWDLYMAGETSAMTDMQINGWELLRDETTCINCHTPPLFTDNQYWNIGVRPAAEDAGRMEVTSHGSDYGRFKTASLRNIGLRNSLMHNGQMFNTKDAIDFYMANHHATRHTQFDEFQTGIPIGDGELTDDYSGAHVHMVTPEGEPLQMPVLEFLNTALTDPRVASEAFPFDRPKLGSEPPDTDNDGMLDAWEIAHGLDELDPSDAALDADGDTLTNLDEFNYSTDPNDVDSDNDWIKDHFEIGFLGTNPNTWDTDGDTLPDFWEAIYFVGPTDAMSVMYDPDGDSYTNMQEYMNGTSPRSADP